MKTPPAPPKERKRSLSAYSRALGRAHQKASNQLETSMPLLQHLNELRERGFKAFAAVLLTTLASFIFAPQLIDFLATPIGGKEALVSIEVTENISIFMRVSLLCGIALGMPIVVYQAFRFVLPGLKAKERSWLLLGVPFATILFLTGIAFTWFVMLPTAIPFLVNFMGITTQVRPANYFEFITKLMFWIGLSFEMPLIIFLLAKLKFVTAAQLAHGWRYAVVAIALVGAVVTPTVDPVNMLLVMLPLLGLYVVSIFLAAFAGRE